MKEFEIYLNDWGRIFFGEVPAGFYVEVIIRAFFVYLLLMVSMRLMGKRMATHLSRNELIAMVALAAAIGVPMMSPDRGILPAFVIAFIVVFVQRLLSKISFGSQKAEALLQGDLTILVEDGRMNLEHMRANRITRERLFAQLRSAGIDNLGKVKRLYLESAGGFSIVENQEKQMGLPVLPRYDNEFRDRRQQASDSCVCNECGHAGQQHTSSGVPCERCGQSQWVTGYW